MRCATDGASTNRVRQLASAGLWLAGEITHNGAGCNTIWINDLRGARSTQMTNTLGAFGASVNLNLWIQLTSCHHYADVRRVVLCPGHEGTRAPYTGAVENCQVSGATEYVGMAHLPKRRLQLPVAFDEDDDGRGRTAVLEHRVGVSTEATDDHVVTNSLVDLFHVIVRPICRAQSKLSYRGTFEKSRSAPDPVSWLAQTVKIGGSHRSHEMAQSDAAPYFG